MMNQDCLQYGNDPVEEAIARRLTRLGNRPVDMARLQRRIEAEIPRHTWGNLRWPQWARRSWRAAAALLMVGLTVAALLLASSSGPALASPTALAQLHEDVVMQDVTPVSSIRAANAALAGKWPQAPALPEVPREHVMHCCMQKLGRAKTACVVLTVDGQRVTMAAANAGDVHTPEQPRIRRNGTDFTVQASGRLSMVMTQRDGKWYCLIGALPAERMMDFWNGLEK